jgi:nicotinamidase-related amidase
MTENKRNTKESPTKFYDLVDWTRFMDKDETAFIVVDAQNDILEEKGNLNSFGTWKIARDKNCVGNIKRIVLACRKVGIPIIWVRQLLRADENDLFPGTYMEALVKRIRTEIPGFLQGGTWDTEICDELKKMIGPKDLIIDKPLFSTFEGTNLQSYLNSLGTRTILACGFETDVCVEGTLRSAFDRGYMSVLIEDASATTTQLAHNEAIARHGSLSPVVTTDELVKLLEAM